MYAPTYRTTSNGRTILILSFLALVAFAVAYTKIGLIDVGTSRSHAEQKHGTVVTQMVRSNCTPLNNTFQLWKDPISKHLYEGCTFWDDDGKEYYGVRIVDKDFEEITTIMEEGDLNDLENYMLNRGYGQIQ